METGIEEEQRDAFPDTSLGSLMFVFYTPCRIIFFIFSDSINPIHQSSSHTYADMQLFFPKWTTPDILSYQHIDSAGPNPHSSYMLLC